MKKLAAAFVMAAFALTAVAAQENDGGLTITGEVRTGLFWHHEQRGGHEPRQSGFVHNSWANNWALGIDHFRANQGLYRVNFHWNLGEIGTRFLDTVGTRFRMQTTHWAGANVSNIFSHAFAYAYMFDRQFKVSGGGMGDSPWGTGGPEMYRELDTVIGMRFEFIPSFIPFIRPGSLNFGFVLNNFDSASEGAYQAGHFDASLRAILQESVLGLAYTHDYFLVRVAYRLDSESDDIHGEQLIYRLEERILSRFLPGFQIFANGHWRGLNSDLSDGIVSENWIYFHYEPPVSLTNLNIGHISQIRLGLDSIHDRRILHVRPSFYLTLLDNFVQVGTAFEFASDIGEMRPTRPDGSDFPYIRWFIEPMIRLNFGDAAFGRGVYLALVYRFQSDYQNIIPPVPGSPPGTPSLTGNTVTHWINLRLTYLF